MSIEDAIYTHATDDAGISALIGARIYPGYASQNTTVPYIVYQRISSVPINLLAADTDITEARWQFNCYGTSYPSAVAVVEAVRTAFARYSGTVASIEILDVFIENVVDRYDDEQKLFQIAVDMLIQHRG